VAVASYRRLGHDFSSLRPEIFEDFTAQEFRFADFTLDRSRYQLRRGERLLRLEKLPMDLLIFLAERPGELVSRDQIAERLWGKDVFVDVDHSINVAIRKIRTALKDDPEKPRFVETVIGRGYRFAAPVASGNGDSPAQVQSLPPPAQTAPAPAVLPTAVLVKERRTSSARMLLVLVAVMALLAVAWLLIRGGGAWSTARLPIRSLAVLPLKNLSGDPTQDYLADGMTEELIGRLAQIHDLRVISRTSSMHFKDSQLSVPEIAKTLNVDAIVEGSVTREGSRIRVHAQLIRAATDEHFWSETYDRELQDVLGLESEVAQSIAGKVEVTITGKERERLATVRSVSPEVYESYLKGRFAWGKANSRADVEESIGYFEQAIKKDPTFAPGYLGLANAYSELGSVFIGDPPEKVRPQAILAARKALELDPESAEAHVLLANMQQAQWQWSEAEVEYQRALALNPNDAAAHLAFAYWLLCHGRTDEAVTWAQRGRQLDPLAVSGDDLAWILFLARRYDESEREVRSLLAMHPDDAGALWDLGFALIANGQPEAAVPALEKARAVSNRSPGVTGVLIRAYAHAGRRTDALRLLAELKKRKQAGYIPAAAFVNAYLGLGDNEQAFVWLEKAYTEQSIILQWVKVHPYFDPIRGDRRFADLVRRVGLN
jgi:TolB-like protein/DNA-binding winged helix-turn-helix (wHTH) protein/tetratricopeptide (TPR) repeat protein